LTSVAFNTAATAVNPHPNGNGSGAVNGRGLRHRKLTRSEALELAADVACGRPFAPSLHHLADIFGVPVGSLSKAVKARTAAQEAPVEVALTEETPIEPQVAIGEPLLEPFGTLLWGWRAATPVERESFVREIGVDAVWDVITRLIR
jgi:hypothetical protein